MRLRRGRLATGETSTLAWDRPRERWVALRDVDELDPALRDDVVAVLAEDLASIADLLAEQADADVGFAPLLPFQPRSLRGFANSEQHWIQSARGLLREHVPAALPAIQVVERLTGRTFAPLKPGRLFYSEPSFYFGNALTVVADGAEIRWPGYTEWLDFELELGAVLVRELYDATPQDAMGAIGGFVVINDFSARDTQWSEFRGGLFGPVVKTKSFATGMSAEVVSADEILPRARELAGTVHVNGELWSRTSTADMRWSYPEMAAAASRGEQLQAGELLSGGTLTSGCGLELGRRLACGDEVRLEIEGVATLTNKIGAR